MSRSATVRSIARIAALGVAAFSFSACSDGVEAPPNGGYTPPDAVHESELVLFVGDTLDLSAQLDLSSESVVGQCSSGDDAIAAMDGAIRVVGSAAGDVMLFCTRSTMLDPQFGDGGSSGGVETTFQRYQITAHVREREVIDPPAAGPSADPTLDPTGDPGNEPPTP